MAGQNATLDIVVLNRSRQAPLWFKYNRSATLRAPVATQGTCRENLEYVGVFIYLMNVVTLVKRSLQACEIRIMPSYETDHAETV
jgi:hypothetical protein